MGYFVVHPGGQQYGPADMATLNQWAAEGRLIADTALIDAATGAHVLARNVPGLFFPLNPGHPAMHGQSAPTVMPGPAVGTPLGGYRPPQTTNAPYGSGYPPQAPRSSPGSGMAPAITASYIASILGMILVCCAPLLTVIAGVIGVGLGASANSIDPGRARGAIWLGIGAIVLGVLFAGGMTILGRMVNGG